MSDSTVSARPDNVRKGVYILPNLFTTGTLFAGFYGMVASMNGRFDIAAWMIIVAGIFDGTDGKVARWTNTTSRFGVEYDSLADVVAFGVAPGILMYSWALQPFGKYGWLAAFLYVACGALRLARFNVQTGTIDSKYFVGLPIPASAGVAATAVLLFYDLGGTGTITNVLIVVLVYALALLMVSNVRYYSFKDPDLFKRKPFWTLIAAIVFIVVIVALKEIMLFAIGFCYMISGPIVWLLRRKRVQERVAAKEQRQGASRDGEEKEG